MTTRTEDAGEFAASLRTRSDVIRLGAPDAETIALRVQMPELWAVVRLDVPPDEPVANVKAAALEALDPRAQYPDEFVLKLAGVEVLDEQVSLAQAGVRDGSIFLLTHRRRRPVR